MPRVYLDNAATTPLDPEVIEVMTQGMKTLFGNPSSIHAQGREARAAIEKARKKIAAYLGCTPSEIFFTSGGTEADNMAIYGSVQDLGIRHIISSPLEHHAVLHTIEHLRAKNLVTHSFVDADAKGKVSLSHLSKLLEKNPKSLVSLMEANNEVGTLNPILDIGEICEEYKAVFHSDTVQTMGHYKHSTASQKVHFMACAAHKLHGPKGVGFIYIRNTLKISPFIHGGSQERNMRGGTENMIGILGLSKAFELAEENLEAHQLHIQHLKTHMSSRILSEISGAEINGANDSENSLYTVLNISFPESEMGEMLLFNLDIMGISASGGSACSSGSNTGSHVLAALGVNPNRPAVRFSFSKMNTLSEIDFTVDALKKILSM
jgi:cysteine desulfurase